MDSDSLTQLYREARRLAQLHVRLAPRAKALMGELAQGRTLREASSAMGWSEPTMKREAASLRRNFGGANGERCWRVLPLWAALHAPCCLGRPTTLERGGRCRTGSASSYAVAQLLAYALGYSAEEVARLCGRSPHTVRTNVKRLAHALALEGLPPGLRPRAALWAAHHARCCLGPAA